MAGICFSLDGDSVSSNLEIWAAIAATAGDIDRLAFIHPTAPYIPDGAEIQSETQAEFHVYARLIDFLTEQSGSKVFVCHPWEIPDFPEAASLWLYDHDIDWYIFGPAAGWISLEGCRTLYIPQAGRVALPPVNLAAAVMLHRLAVVNAEIFDVPCGVCPYGAKPSI
jgi:hypothetical protein